MTLARRSGTTWQATVLARPLPVQGVGPGYMFRLVILGPVDVERILGREAIVADEALVRLGLVGGIPPLLGCLPFLRVLLPHMLVEVLSMLVSLEALYADGLRSFVMTPI